MADRRSELRKVARDIARDDRRLSALARTPQLADSSLEDGSVDVYDADGNLAAVIGKQWDGAQGVASLTGPTPPTPVAPIVTGGVETLTVRWTGTFGDLDGVEDITVVPPMDFSRVEAHVSTDPDFIADTADTLVGTIESPRGGEVVVTPLEPGVYYARLVARSIPGKSGADSAVTSGTVLAADAYVLPGGKELGEKLAEADSALEAHEERLGVAENDLAVITALDLPALGGKLDTLEDVTLPALESELGTLKDVTLPAVQGDLATLKDTTLPALDAKVNTLKDTDLPALEGRLDDAETAINETIPDALADAKLAADMALLIAPISTSAPVLADGTVNGVVRPTNSVWTRIDGSGNEIGYWRWTGTAWVAMALTTTVIPNLAASKITSGTIATARLSATEIAAAVATIIQLNADRITAGTIDTARLNVQQIAAQVATVIELNADRITSGSIATARLNAAEIAAAVATVIQLNADRITSGTVNTDRLNATEIAARVATVIELNASRITSGTIATARLDTLAIAAATAAFQTVDVANLFTSAATIDEAVVEKLWAEVVLAKQITAEMIEAGAIKAAHLDVVAGDPLGARMELKSDGLKLYGPDGAEAVNLSSVPPHYIGITDAEGSTLASLSDDGTVSGRRLNIEEDPVLQGFPLFGWTNADSFPQTTAEGFMDYLPRGIVARGYRSMASASVATNQEREILELSYMRYARRAYKIHVSPVAGYLNTTGAYGYLKVYYTSDGSRPTMNDANLLQVKTLRTPVAGSNMLDWGTTWYDLADDGRNHVRRYLFTYEALNGGITWFGNTRDGSQFRVWVEDMGLDIPETGVDRNGSRANGGTTPSAPVVDEVKNYTKTYTASGYRSFYTSGGFYNYSTSKMFQGSSPYAGGLQSIATFPSMTGDLSGATITGIRAYFYFEHWYYNSGGTAKIGVHGSATVPSSKPTITTVATSSGWPKPGGRWVNIPSTYWAGFKSGTYKGVALGDGSPGLIEYGYARGSATKIEIKYKK